MTIQITCGPSGQTLAEMRDAARRAEEADAAIVWCPELHASATVTAAAFGHATRRAHVATAIARTFIRRPMTLALETLDLDELTEEVRGRLAAYDGLANTVKLAPPTRRVTAGESRSSQEQIIEMIADISGGTR